MTDEQIDALVKLPAGFTTMMTPDPNGTPGVIFFEADMLAHARAAVRAALAGMTAERDAAFAMSRCECGTDEACKNLATMAARIAELSDALAKLVRDADSEPDGEYLEGANKGSVAVHRARPRRPGGKAMTTYKLVPVELLRDALDSVEDHRAGHEFGAHHRKLIDRLNAARAVHFLTTPAPCVDRAALSVSARKALAAWDSTVLPQSNDGMLQEAMERLRAAIAATKGQP